MCKENESKWPLINILITINCSILGLMKKCFWGILTMISTVLLCLHLWSLITGYLSYDTVTNVSLRESRSLVFPG